MNFSSCNFKTETGLWALTWAQAFHRLRWKFINRISRQISRRLETAQVTRVTGHQDQAPSGVSWSMTIWIPWEYCEVHEGHRSSPGAATSAAYPLISLSHRWNHLSLILAKKSIKSWDVFLVIHPSPATLYGSSSGTGMRGLLRISTGLSFFTESKEGCYWQTKSTGWQLILPGGIFDLSISMATMLMSMTQQGCSRMSVSFFTKATAEMHWRREKQRWLFLRDKD